MNATRTICRRGRGFLLTEAVISLSLLMLMFTLLGASVTHHRRVSRVLADDRAAVRLAERVLGGVELDEAALAASQISVRVEPLETPDGWSDRQRQWVKVTVTCRSRTQSLVGLMSSRQVEAVAAEVLP